METQTTPDNVAYLFLGLAVIVVIMGGYLVSLAARYRNLQKDLELVETLGETNSQ